MNNKKEYAVGDTVQLGFTTMVCMERPKTKMYKGRCFGCHLRKNLTDNCVIEVMGYCIKEKRTDNKDVIFKLKDD